VTSGFDCVDIRHFYVPYGLPCDQVRPSRNGLTLRLDEWKHLLKLVPTIHKRHPELIIAEPNDEENSQRLYMISKTRYLFIVVTRY